MHMDLKKRTVIRIDFSQIRGSGGYFCDVGHFFGKTLDFEPNLRFLECNY